MRRSWGLRCGRVRAPQQYLPTDAVRLTGLLIAMPLPLDRAIRASRATVTTSFSSAGTGTAASNSQEGKAMADNHLDSLFLRRCAVLRSRPTIIDGARASGSAGRLCCHRGA